MKEQGSSRSLMVSTSWCSSSQNRPSLFHVPHAKEKQRDFRSILLSAEAMVLVFQVGRDAVHQEMTKWMKYIKKNFKVRNCSSVLLDVASSWGRLWSTEPPPNHSGRFSLGHCVSLFVRDSRNAPFSTHCKENGLWIVSSIPPPFVFGGALSTYTCQGHREP